MSDTAAVRQSTREQHKTIADGLIELGHTSREARLARLSFILGRPVRAFAALTYDEAARIEKAIAGRLAGRGQ